MFYLYDKGKAQSITDAGTEIHLQMEKVFRAFGGKAKIERIYEEGCVTSFEELRHGSWRENKETVAER
jgi:hypothetical protein